MSTQDTTPISAQTIQAATTRADILRRELALIGTLTGGGTPRALLRTANGRILTVAVGEKAGRDTVVGIEDGRVVLARGQRTWSLEMPKG
jgi:hypothetical protein